MPSIRTAASRTPERRWWRRAAGLAVLWGIDALPVLLASARCPRVQLLHVACPGCGMSRAFARLAHGELRESLTMHPLAVPMLLAQVALAAVTVMVTLERGSPLELCKVRYGCTSLLALAVAAAFVVLLWIVKMMGFAGGPVLV